MPSVNLFTASSGAWERLSSLFLRTAPGGSVRARLYGTSGAQAIANIDDVALSEPVVREFWKTDDDNKWWATVDCNGRPVVYERVAGTDTPRISGVDGDHTAGDNLRIIHFYDAESDRYFVYLWINTTDIGDYDTATAQTGRLATVKQVGSGAAISDSVIYDRNQSGNLPSQE